MMDKEQNYELNYRLKSGMTTKIELTKDDVLVWLECFKNNQRFVPKHGSILGINPDLVASFNIPSLKDHDIKEQLSPIIESNKMVEDSIEQPKKQETNTFNIPEGKAPFKIVCQCKARYVVTTYDTITTFKCKYCGRELYRIYEKGIVETRFGPGYLLSN